VIASDMSPSPVVPPMLLTVDQVAQLLQVSARTVWRMRSGGELPAPIRVLGSVRWRRTEVESWVNARTPAS
jgi:excisionase family DNA binding protein